MIALPLAELARVPTLERWVLAEALRQVPELHADQAPSYYSTSEAWAFCSGVEAALYALVQALETP